MMDESLWGTVGPHENVVRLLEARERRGSREATARLRRRMHYAAPLVQRFGLESMLEGHQGCVNCLEWSGDGRTLASGSDDTVIRLWDPFTAQCLQTVYTTHIGNIFSVKFVGDGTLLATGAGDCRVIVQSIFNTHRQSALLDCSCHRGRVKRLANAPEDPHVFFSAGEDGFILQYDIREQHECLRTRSVFVNRNLTTEFKCIAVNPTKPHIVAVGANDSYIRLYDRRMVRSPYVKDYNPAMTKDCVQYYTAGHLARDSLNGEQCVKLVATYVTFDKTGTKMLVNMGGEHIYTFNLNNDCQVDRMQVPDNLPKHQAQPNFIKPCCEVRDSLRVQNILVHKYDYKIDALDQCACDYLERAARLYERKWLGDVYSAARDYFHVIQRWPQNRLAYLGLIDCFICLKWPDEAANWTSYFQIKFPFDEEQIQKLHERVNRIQPVQHVCENLEDSCVFSNLAMDCDENEKQLRLNSIDFESRFIGHCNTTTDIKEANFMGDNGDFICAGSDDGMIFIWDAKTTNLLTALIGDLSIVNCVQPHPTTCYMASSGIDAAVKIWSPRSEENFTNRHLIRSPWLALESNQERMCLSPFETMLINMGYRVSNRLNTTCRPS